MSFAITPARSLLVAYSDTVVTLTVISGTVWVSGLCYTPDCPSVFLPVKKDVLIQSETVSSVELKGKRVHYWLTESVGGCCPPRVRRAVYAVFSKQSDVALTLGNKSEGSVLLDLNLESDAFLPAYRVGGPDCQFYQTNPSNWSPFMLVALSQSVQRQKCQSPTVILHCPPALLLNLAPNAMESRLKQLQVDYVLLEDNDKLYYHLQQIRFPCLKLTWPQVQDQPLAPPPPFDLQSLEIKGVFRRYHLPPLTCLPLGSQRLLTEQACYLEEWNGTRLNPGIYGLTDHLPFWAYRRPVWTRGVVDSITALIRVTRTGALLLSQQPGVYSPGSPVYLVAAAAADLVPAELQQIHPFGGTVPKLNLGQWTKKH